VYHIKVTRPGSLESVLLDGDITHDQVSIVIALLKDPTITYGEVLAFLASRRRAIEALPPWDPSDEDSVNGTFAWGAGESVEAYRG